MWDFDIKTRKYFNNCNLLDKCCFYCKNRLDGSCEESCFNDKQEIKLTEKHNEKFHCKNCKHK